MSKLKSGIKDILLYKVFRYWNICHHLFPKFRTSILRKCGAKVGENVYISGGVYMDNHVNYLEIGNDVLISPNVMFLFHKRDLSHFSYGEFYNKQPHVTMNIKIENNVAIGMGAIIMPGVTIGEGSSVAAGALVTKDVPAWSVVAGIPAKVIRTYKKKLVY